LNIDRTSAARPQVTPPTTPVDATPSPTSPVASERAAAEARLERVGERTGDRIELSAEARGITTEPDAAREATIAALRAQVDAGTYQVDANGVARLIVDRGDV